jgi:hypothetical protein
MSEFITLKASELKLGDMVDLAEGEFFQSGDPDAPSPIHYELGVVDEIVHDSADCIAISFENIGVAGYAPDHPFKVQRRELAPDGWYERYAQDEDEVEDDIDEVDTEPEEGDYTTGDHRKFYQYGKLVCEVPEDEDWQDHVRRHMNKEQFWPNVWWISDHGNAHLLNAHEKD